MRALAALTLLGLLNFSAVAQDLPKLPTLSNGQVDMSKFSAPDANGLRYSPGTTPAQQAQLRALVAQQRALGTVISRSLLDAINLIVNEPAQVSGIVRSDLIPRQLSTALERAALHAQVHLVTLGAPLRLKRTDEAVLANSAIIEDGQVNVIATSRNVIVLKGQAVEIYAAPNGVQGLHQHVAGIQQLIRAGSLK